ncbi:hypothetical protein [Variovorax sp. RKNM96]|uniref:hypothetical protein n=1 Tax=Variovorax sp. RKNM96 TaxID=2681552 RepID=UPI0019808A43|nr:hypothetical protein [Variovorax sp. RKNM96]
MKHTLLVDADIVAFKFASKAQRTTPFGAAVDDLDTVTPKVDAWLAELKDSLKATDLIICLSCPSEEGWRMQVLPTYKGNRKDTVRPVHLGPLKDYMEHAYPSYRKPTLEADDIMGILSTHPTLVPGRKTIVSEDKDMKTIPGWLYNPAKDSKPHLISEAAADEYHAYQALIGDATDHYKGCPGCGPVKAHAVLAHAVLADLPLWPVIVDVYLAKGLTEEDALVQARVARISRATDYDFKKKTTILWTPASYPLSPALPACTAATTS